MIEPSHGTRPEAPQSSGTTSSVTTSTGTETSQTLLTLASEVPDTDSLPMSTHFKALPQEEQNTIANEAWIMLHLTGNPDRLRTPHSAEVLDAFAVKTGEIAFARLALLSTRSEAATRTRSSHPTPPAPCPPRTPHTPILATHISPPPAATTTPTSSAKHDYSLLVPIGTAASAIGANALRNEIQEHILCRAGYVPLNALTNETIQYFAANPAALKLELKPARTTQGSLEKRWIPVLTDLITSETRLTRSLWAEAAKNLIELLSSQWGSSHELTIMWKSYFDSLLAHKLFRSETDFASILKFDIKTRSLWWTGSELFKLAPDIMEDLATIHHDELELRLRNIASAAHPQPPNHSYRSLPPQHSSLPHRPRTSYANHAKPYDRPPLANGSFRPGDRATSCIICTRTSHKASDCRELKTSAGSHVVAEFNGNLLRSKTDKRPICFSFNIGRAENSSLTRSHTDQGMHRCSLCLGPHGAHACSQHL